MSKHHPAEIKSVTGTVTYADGRTSTFEVFDASGQWAWSQRCHSMDAVGLGQRGFGDVLDKLTTAIGDHQDGEVPDTHWHIGSNHPGYLPESDVVCVLDEPGEARAALIGQLERALNAYDVCPGEATGSGNQGRHDEGQCGDCDAYRTIQAVLDEPDQIRPALDCGYELAVSDERGVPVVHWISPVPREDCEVDDE